MINFKNFRRSYWGETPTIPKGVQRYITARDWAVGNEGNDLHVKISIPGDKELIIRDNDHGQYLYTGTHDMGKVTSFTLSKKGLVIILKTNETHTLLYTDPVDNLPDIGFSETAECESYWQPASYSDQIHRIVFTFSRDINEDEFVSYLVNCTDEEIKAKLAWYSNYSHIFGEGNKWAIDSVEPYTD